MRPPAMRNFTPESQTAAQPKHVKFYHAQPRFSPAQLSMFRCDAPTTPYMRRGIISVLALQRSAVGDFEEDHALVATRKLDRFFKQVLHTAQQNKSATHSSFSIFEEDVLTALQRGAFMKAPSTHTRLFARYMQTVVGGAVRLACPSHCAPRREAGKHVIRDGGRWRPV